MDVFYHLQHQKYAGEDGVIVNSNDGTIFHKNLNANLASICEDCHQNIHKSEKQHKKVKTSKGIIIREL